MKRACMISSKRSSVLPPGLPTWKKASSAPRSSSLATAPVSAPCSALSSCENRPSRSSCSRRMQHSAR